MSSVIFLQGEYAMSTNRTFPSSPFSPYVVRVSFFGSQSIANIAFKRIWCTNQWLGRGRERGTFTYSMYSLKEIFYTAAYLSGAFLEQFYPSTKVHFTTQAKQDLNYKFA